MFTGNIHGHTMFSVKDSALTVRDYLRTVKDLGGKGAVLTDHGVLTGIPDLIRASKETGIKGIPGIEMYITRKDDPARSHLVLIAKDYLGYQAIMRAATAAQENLVHGFPCLEEERLNDFFGSMQDAHGHVIATSACALGVLNSILLKNYTLDEELRMIHAKMDALDADAIASCPGMKDRLDALDTEIQEKKARLNSMNELARQKFAQREKSLASRKGRGEDVSAEEELLLKAKAESEEAAQEAEALTSDLNALREERKALAEPFRAAEKVYAKYRKLQDQADAAEAGRIPDADLNSLALQKAFWYGAVFGMQDFFLEFQNHGLDMEKVCYPKLAELYRILHTAGIRAVASNDTHYALGTEDDVRARWLVRSMRFNHAEEEHPSDNTYGMLSDEDLLERLDQLIPHDIAEESVWNIGTILDACQVDFPEAHHFPKFETGTGETAIAYLRRMAEEGIERRYAGRAGWTEEHAKRLEYELSVIEELGYADYLDIVEDFLREGRRLGTDNPEQVGMGVGPGRGSAVGSLVCYLTGITDIDPMRFGLLFERFLNRDRVSYPDIDSDFGTEVRGKVIDYVKERYGEHGVCCIITHGTQAARASIRSAARILADRDHSTDYGKAADLLCSVIPEGQKITLSDCDASFQSITACDPAATELLAHARLIEGVVTQYGMHAAGVIIADNGDVGEYIPLAYNPDQGQWMSQYTAPDDEKLAGLLKMDFLGLNNLDIITDTLRLIRKNHGISLNMTEIGRSLTDGRTTPFDVMPGSCIDEIFAKGRTNGVFQFESQGMKSLLRRFRPRTIEDIALLNAVYRPGPMQYIDRICDAHAKGVMPDQILPQLNTILTDTYGYPVYQESVMRICHEIAGMTMGQADMVRWAMSKKKTGVLKTFHEPFTQGLVRAGATARQAEDYWAELQSFASYGFNKSHAVAYAFVAFYTAWLKYNYPCEYMTALLNHSESSDIPELIRECRALGIQILPPDLNRSESGFTCMDNRILFGLSSIRGIKSAADQVVSERPFSGLEDFLARSAVSDSAARTLILCGALDAFHRNRTVMAAMVEPVRDTVRCLRKATEARQKAEEDARDPEEGYAAKALRALKKAQEKEAAYQAMLDEQHYPDTADEPLRTLAKYESDYLGIPVSWDPIAEYGSIWMQESAVPISDAIPGQNGVFCGIVTGLSTRLRKSDGLPMAFFTLQDSTGEIPVCCFVNQYAQYGSVLRDGAGVRIEGRTETRDGRTQLVCSSAAPLPEHLPVVEMHVSDLTQYKKHIELVRLYAGNDYVLVLIDDLTHEERSFKEPIWVSYELLNQKFPGVTFRLR